MIYIFVGNSCSGKTEAAVYLSSRLQVPHLEASKFMKEIRQENAGRSVELIFEEFGRDIVASRMMEASSNPDKAVISGFRTPEEISYVKKLKPAFVIGIYASDRTCFLRGQKRNRTGHQKNFNDFYRDRVCADYDLGLASIMQRDLDILIENESDDLNKFYESLDRFQEIKK
jgi:dephospho-CoA kinase